MKNTFSLYSYGAFLSALFLASCIENSGSIGTKPLPSKSVTPEEKLLDAVNRFSGFIEEFARSGSSSSAYCSILSWGVASDDVASALNALTSKSGSLPPVYNGTCGWEPINPTVGGYYCTTHEKSDPTGFLPRICQGTTLVEGYTCGTVPANGCCDANNSVWRCLPSQATGERVLHRTDCDYASSSPDSVKMQELRKEVLDRLINAFARSGAVAQGDGLSLQLSVRTNRTADARRLVDEIQFTADRLFDFATEPPHKEGVESLEMEIDVQSSVEEENISCSSGKTAFE